MARPPEKAPLRMDGPWKFIRSGWAAVDGLDVARLVEDGGVVWLHIPLEAEDGFGDRVLTWRAGDDLGFDVLVAEEAWDLGVVMMEVVFEALEDGVERGRLRPLGRCCVKGGENAEEDGDCEQAFCSWTLGSQCWPPLRLRCGDWLNKDAT